MGVGIPVLVVPRFITAVVYVWGYNLVMVMRGKVKAVSAGSK